MSRAFLLAGGEGKRLRPLTYFMPKCLVPIRGRRLLGIWLDLLRKHGINEVFINIYSHPSLVESYLNQYSQKNNAKVISFDDWDESKNNFIIVTYIEKKLIGNAGIVLRAKRFMCDSCLILYADNLTNMNLRDIINQHEGFFTLGLFETNKPKESGIATLNDGLVTDFVEKPQSPKSNLANAGVYVAGMKLIKIMEKIQSNHKYNIFDFGHHILPELIGRIRGYIIKDYFLDIGTWGNYIKSQFTW